MDPRVIPCDQCGTPIGDEDLESGAAIHLKGRSFCGACKIDATKAFTLEDLTSPGAAPRTKPAGNPAPARKAAPPPPAKMMTAPPAAEKLRPQTRPRSAASPPSKQGSRMLPLLGGLGAAALIGILSFLLAGRSTPAAPNPGTNAVPSTGPKIVPGLSPAEQARQLLGQIESQDRNGETPSDEVLARLDRSLPALKGTEYEARAAEILKRIQKVKDAVRADLELNPILADLKKKVAADTDFKYFPALRDQFQKARELAARSAPARILEIQQLHADYNTRYEKAAEPYYTEIHEAAMVLADERRYADALRKIETFPEHLRHSGTWKGLAQLKADVEKRAKALPLKK